MNDNTRDLGRASADSGRGACDAGGGDGMCCMGVDIGVFRKMVGESFDTSRREGAGVSLVLEKVMERELSNEPRGGKHVSLLFAGPRDSILPQGTYRVSHQAIGVVAIFLVPLGPGRDRRINYQAVFA